MPLIPGAIPHMTTSTAGGIGLRVDTIAGAGERGSANSRMTLGPSAVQLSTDTPLASLLTEAQGLRAEAVVVSRNLPPVPAKIAEKIWRGEYVDLDGLLPSRLGVPEPTLRDLIGGEKTKKREKRHQDHSGVDSMLSLVRSHHPEEGTGKGRGHAGLLVPHH